MYPTEGAMLFWYNLHSDGSIIEDSLHSGCPVLYGVKTGKLLEEALQVYNII